MGFMVATFSVIVKNLFLANAFFEMRIIFFVLVRSFSAFGKDVLYRPFPFVSGPWERRPDTIPYLEIFYLPLEFWERIPKHSE